MLLEEFEEDRAIIEPEDRGVRSAVFERCEILIYTFSDEIVQRVSRLEGVRQGGFLESLNGRNSWYMYDAAGLTVAVMKAYIGAPMAVGQLEELRALGFEKFILVGSCGVLDQKLAADRIVLPESALRDEGTSYHYVPASWEIRYDEALLAAMERALARQGIPCIRAKTWTTDAFYRETASKVRRRLAAGAAVVEMEAASLMAWAQFRQAKVYQFFYTADYVDHRQEVWDQRQGERTADVMAFFDIALMIAKEVQDD